MTKRLLNKILPMLLMLLMGNVNAFADFKDVKVNLVSDLLTDDEAQQGQNISYGVVVADDGSLTRVAADDASANAVISGTYHNNHGWRNFKATVPVTSYVKISMAACQYGGPATVKAGDTTIGTIEVNKLGCAHPTGNLVSAYYAEDAATTITVEGGGYVSYFAVEAIAKSDIPNTAKLTFAMGNETAEGTLPADQEVEKGTQVTLTANHSLYVEGKTLTAWTDGTKQYAAGESVTVNDDLTLTPVFTANTANLADRTGTVDLVWQLGNKNNEKTPINLEKKTGILVTQGYVNGKAIDVKADVDATEGKLNNVGRGDEWAQVNSGVKVTIPSAKNAVVKLNAYQNITTTTINGQKGYTEGTTIEYTITESDATAELVLSDGSYYSYIALSLPADAKAKIQEKSLYSTDFSEWDALKAAKSETQLTKKTKYSDETFTVGLYNTAVMDLNDTKFQNYTELPRRCLQAQKAADPYITTTTLADVTKVRFIHGATGSNRGWKLEAKGDGDEDWVVISNAVANPAAWTEVNAQVNRKNVQLRFTNLNAEQNAYMFELEIFGNVDMTNKPMLASFKANGELVEADIFNMNSAGTYEATIEVSKTKAMISQQNPITDVTADNGEVGNVTYTTTGTGNAQTTVATIPVSVNGNSVNYEATFVFKPDFTLTYKDADGNKTIGTQTVEKDAAIAAFAYGADNVTVAEGQQFRGWAIATSGLKNRKYTTEDIITENTTLYALVTDIEEASASQRYDYQLNDRYFYAEDHEAFNPQGGEFHDLTHGWVFGANDKIELLMGKKGYVKLGLCQYSNSGAITLTDGTGAEQGTVEAKVSADGKIGVINFDGAEGTYTLSFAGTTYLHDLSIVNLEDEPFETSGVWTELKESDNADVNGQTFLTALELANAAPGTDRIYIYLPNGDYNLGERALTTISRNNISIVGQSMEGVIIRNHPTAEGIGITATLLNQSTGLYLQNITLKNELDYFNSAEAGRAVCLQDKGNKTICKQVRMLSYQDTYYSNTNGMLYWEKSEIHGVVDYLCGGGDVFFNKTLLVNESRSKTPKSGDVTMTAPYIDAGNKFGYVLNECVIENKAKSFNFGRSWGGESRLYYVNTTINQPNEIAKTRFTTGGMNTLAYEFKEYNSVDPQGNVVSPASNILTFTKDGNSKKYETIMTAEEADAVSYEKYSAAKNWDPRALCADMPEVTVKQEGYLLTWEPVANAVAYSVYDNGEFLGVTEETQFDLSTDSPSEAKSLKVGAEGQYTVMAHNALGTFGTKSEIPSSIQAIANNNGLKVIGTAYYTLSGARVAQPQQGVNICVQTMENGQTVATKVIVK